MTTAVGRATQAVRLRYRVLANRGDVVECPLCGHRFARFRDDWNRPNAICWRCGSHERHRALWVYLNCHRELLAPSTELLHFAPEWCLEHRLRGLSLARYLTADLEPGAAELEIDITNIALGDEAFAAILCSHVLEHVVDDAAAMRELHRVLKPGGWAIVMVPLDTSRSESLEDPAIVDPAERERAFLQWDHVRLYAHDIADRLTTAGFDVGVETVARDLGSERAARYGLLDSDHLFVCRKATAHP